MGLCMLHDDVAWEQSDLITDTWVHDTFKTENLRAIGDFILKHRRGSPEELCDPKGGAFNVSFRMKYRTGYSVMIRFTKPGSTMFPQEKTRYEIATIRYLQDQTSIPVPFILHFGDKDESPLGQSPFIMMEWIDHATTMNAVLNTPSFKMEDRPILNPDIDVEKLEAGYGQMADILLQLSRASLPQIASLTQVDDFTWESTARPLTFSMNELVRLGTFPRLNLPNTSFDTASSYFECLADLHIQHLDHQRNDAIYSEIDCRRKFVARVLFRKLAREQRFTSPITNRGPFPLWCDDFRPSNVLVNEDDGIVGVVDWEFTYAAPVEFTHAPPWWLLLELPHEWLEGLDAWTEVYDMRLKSFLKALIEREDAAIESGWLNEDQRLSGHMRQSWESGDFWVSYAARNSFAFDLIFWKKLEPRFFGPSELSEQDRWKERLELLEEGEKKAMEELVGRKMEEMKERVLAWEPDEA